MPREDNESRGSLEVIPSATPSAALTYALMKERKRTQRARRAKAILKSTPSDDNENDDNEVVLGEDWSGLPPKKSRRSRRGRRHGRLVKRVAVSKHQQLEIPSPSSGTAASETMSDSSPEPPPRERRKKPKTKGQTGSAFLRNMIRRFTPKRTPNRGPSAQQILDDLDFNSRSQTPVQRNTGSRRRRRTVSRSAIAKVLKDPEAVLERAARYRSRAKKLIDTASCDNGTAESKESQGAPQLLSHTETEAMKAYEYAAEARRLFDLVDEAKRHRREDVIFETTELSIPGPTKSDVSAISESTIDGFKNKSSSPNSGDNDSIVDDDDDDDASEMTSFSEAIEIKYHQKKMKELELMPLMDFSDNIRCSADNIKCSSDDMGDVYTAETKRLIRSMEEQDDLSVMSPASVASVKTTQSELEVRRAHQTKMKELQLFSSVSNMATNVWGAFTGNFGEDGQPPIAPSATTTAAEEEGIEVSDVIGESDLTPRASKEEEASVISSSDEEEEEDDVASESESEQYEVSADEHGSCDDEEEEVDVAPESDEEQDEPQVSADELDRYGGGSYSDSEESYSSSEDQFSTSEEEGPSEEDDGPSDEDPEEEEEEETKQGARGKARQARQEEKGGGGAAAGATSIEYSSDPNTQGEFDPIMELSSDDIEPDTEEEGHDDHDDEDDEDDDYDSYDDDDSSSSYDSETWSDHSSISDDDNDRGANKGILGWIQGL